MYHPTEMANNVTPTSWFYSFYIHTPSNQKQRDCPSRLEFSFLLDTGASTSVLNYPTCVTIAKLLNIKQNNTLSSSKNSDRCKSNRSSYYTLCYQTFKYNNERRLSSVYNTFCSSRYEVQYSWYTLLRRKYTKLKHTRLYVTI